MWKFANWAISRKIVAAFAAVIAVLIVVSGVTWFQVSFIQQSNNASTEAFRSRLVVNEIVTAIADQLSATRGLLITGDGSYVEDYQQATGTYRTLVETARTLGKADPALGGWIDAVAPLVANWQRDIASVEIGLMLTPSNPAAIDHARALEVTGESKRLLGSVRAQTAAFNESQDKLLLQRSDAQATAVATTFTATLLGAVVSLALAGCFCWLLTRGISRPVVTMTAAMTRLAEGDHAAEIPARDRRDEIGQMAHAVEVFKENAIEIERLQAEQEEMEKRAAAEKRRAMNDLADRFSESVAAVVDAVSSAAGEMQSQARSLSATAEETSRQSTAVAAASEQASANVQTVASAAEELSGSIVEIGRQVAESTRIAEQAVEEAGRTNIAVTGLAEAAQKIGEVVSLINAIAEQTNLLALNATIEAARAGEAGKGFAVVASEVKSLATQTAQATEEIGAQISAMQAATGASVSAIEKIGGVISQISEIATAIASAVEQQGAATQEIARNVQQAAAGTDEVSSNITGVTQAAAETGTAAGQVLNTADGLYKQSEALRTHVDGFLGQIRVA
jgi:methyl-accepting chemotaxis protein